MSITIPEEFGFFCTQLTPEATGLPIELNAYMDVNRENNLPFLLYSTRSATNYKGMIVQPFFFEHGAKLATTEQEVLLIQEKGEFAPLPAATRRLIAGFITKNRDALIDHWRLETDSLTFLEQVKRI